MFLRTTDLWVINVNLACVKSLNSLAISGRFVMHFFEGSFHGDEDGKKNCSDSPRGRRRSVPGMSTAFLTVISTFRSIFVCNKV